MWHVYITLKHTCIYIYICIIVIFVCIHVSYTMYNWSKGCIPAVHKSSFVCLFFFSFFLLDSWRLNWLFHAEDSGFNLSYFKSVCDNHELMHLQSKWVTLLSAPLHVEKVSSGASLLFAVILQSNKSTSNGNLSGVVWVHFHFRNTEHGARS